MCLEIVCVKDAVCFCVLVCVHACFEMVCIQGYWILLGKTKRVLVGSVCEFMDVSVPVCVCFLCGHAVRQ